MLDQAIEQYYIRELAKSLVARGYEIVEEGNGEVILEAVDEPRLLIPMPNVGELKLEMMIAKKGESR